MASEKSGFVILHFGAMSADDMMKAAKLAGKDAVIGTDAARMAGASFAFGSTELLDDLQARLAPSARQEAQSQHPGLSPEAIEWLATGQRGMSAEAIFTHLTGIRLRSDGKCHAHPHDQADLRRCRLLLEAVPELQGRIGEMALLSKEWADLAGAWDDLCAQMDTETPDWRDRAGRAPRTYEMMKQILAGD